MGTATLLASFLVVLSSQGSSHHPSVEAAAPVARAPATQQALQLPTTLDRKISRKVMTASDRIILQPAAQSPRWVF